MKKFISKKSGKAVIGIAVVLLLVFAAFAWGQVMKAKTSAGAIKEVRCNASGELSMSGGAGTADGSAFTAGTTLVDVIGAEMDEVAPTACAEGKACSPRITGNRALTAVIKDAAGNERGANVTSANNLTIDLNAQSLTAVKVSDDASANTATNPIYTENKPARYDATGKGNCFAIPSTDTDSTLPTGSDFFEICCYQNGGFLTFADSTPSVTTSVGGFNTYVAEGQCKLRKITETTVAIIGTTAAGFCCFDNQL